ncbi:MAG: DVUA0089 family protein, partial [Planctomycetales bacterium]|nr:DVUA0089 family protein [Planctomycetales bacterium]
MRSLFFSVLAVLASVSVTAARAQDAYISMFGVFHNPGDQHDFTFDLNRSVSSSETLRFQTFAYAGGTNAAGTTFPGGGIDSVLQLFDSGGAPHGVNDDI